MSRDGFVEYIKEVLEPFGHFRFRAMFGGHGIYKSGVMIALLADNELYFKSDKDSANYFKSLGSEPFSYQGKNKPVTMSYWKAIPEIMDDQAELNKWIELAYKAAIAKKV